MTSLPDLPMTYNIFLTAVMRNYSHGFACFLDNFLFILIKANTGKLLTILLFQVPNMFDTLRPLLLSVTYAYDYNYFGYYIFGKF